MKKILCSLSLFMLMPQAMIVGKCGNPNQTCGVKCASIPVFSVPVVIAQPGHYLIPNNLTYAGTGNAITISVSNVTLQFCDGAQLTTTSPEAIAVNITGGSNVTVVNAKLVGTLSDSATSVGVNVTGAENVTLKNATITDFNTNILLLSSNDISISGLVSVENNGTFPVVSHFRARSSNNILLENSQFRAVLASNFLTGSVTLQDALVGGESSNIPCKSVTFRNLELNNSDIFAPLVQGFLAENITSVIDDADYIFSMFQLGTFDTDLSIPRNATDAILRNSTFSNRNANDFAIGVQITQGNGIIVDNIVVDINSAGDNDPDGCQEDPIDFLPSGAKLAIGNNGNSGCVSQVIDCVVRNSIFTSATPTGYGITILGTPAIGDLPTLPNRGIIIDNCLVDNCIVDGILVRNTTMSTIQNCNVINCLATPTSYGINIDANANTNAILNNVISGNSNGILIAAGSTLNTLQNNKVFNNTIFGINNLEASSLIYYNTSCGNFSNCAGVTPSNNPGDPSVVGENLCCTPIPG